MQPRFQTLTKNLNLFRPEKNVINNCKKSIFTHNFVTRNKLDF